MQRVGCRNDRTGIEVFAADSRHGSGQVGSALCTVADDYDFVHQVVRLFQDDVERKIPPPLLDCCGLCDVTQIGDVELGGKGHLRQFESPVGSGQCAFLGSFDRDRRSDNRLSFGVGHSAVYGVVRGGRRFGHGRGLPLGNDDAVSVDRAIDFLPREYLIENFADGGVLGRNGYAFVQIYLVRTDENGVVFGTVQRGHGLLNGYVLQFEIDSLCLSKTRGRAEQQTENNYIEEIRGAKSSTIAVFSHD